MEIKYFTNLSTIVGKEPKKTARISHFHEYAYSSLMVGLTPTLASLLGIIKALY